MKDADVSKKGNEKGVDISIWYPEVENVGSNITSNFCNIGLSYFCPDDDVEKYHCQNRKIKSLRLITSRDVIVRTEKKLRVILIDNGWSKSSFSWI